MSLWRRDSGWTKLRKLIDNGDLPGVVAAVKDLDADTRKGTATKLAEHAKAENRSDLLQTRNWERWAERNVALRVAGIGCISGADAAARWFTQQRLMVWRQDGRAVDAAVELLTGRDPVWLRNLAGRLASRVRARWEVPDQEAYFLASRLVTLAGIDPPTEDGFVFGWAYSIRWAGQAGSGTRPLPGTIVERLRDDPFLDALLPRVFEVEDTATLLAPQPDHLRWTTDTDLTGAIVALAAEGRVDRSMLLDRCLGRLLRGGTATRQRGYTLLHERLDPTVDEIAERTRDYARLLPDAASPVAGLAQAALRRLDDAGRLPLDTLVEGSDAVLFRGERKLVRAQLTWLDAAAKRLRDRPDDLGRTLVAVTTAFEQEGADLKERAVNLVLRHGRHTTDSARAEVRKAAATLPTDLARRVMEGLGDPAGRAAGRAAVAAEDGAAADPVGVTMVTAARPAPAPAPVAPAAMPPPIASPEELIEELAPMARNQYVDLDQSLEAVRLERVLAGLVAFARSDRDRLRDAFEPISKDLALFRDDLKDLLRWSPDFWLAETPLIAVAMRVAIAPNQWQAIWPVLREKSTTNLAAKRVPRSARPNPNLVMLRRLDEIIMGLLAGSLPALVSTPTVVTGHIDPAVLVKRLADAEAAGWTPRQNDLELALLRLPREIDQAAVDDARRLASPAGRALAARLAAGPPPDPVFKRVIHVNEPSHWHKQPESERTRVLVTAADREGGGDAGLPAGEELLSHLSGKGEPLVGAMLFDVRHYGPYQGASWGTSGRLCWPSLLPSHREVIAGHLLPLIGWSRLGDSGGPNPGAVLPLLAETDGPTGPAMAIALVQGLTAQNTATRAATTDALAILARRAQLDGLALGAELAETTRGGLLMLNRAAPALRDAARSGAGQGVLDAVAVALPRLLPPAVERPPNRLAELALIAADLVGEGHLPAAPAAAELRPALDAVVAKGGSSRLAAECRRLHAGLGAR